MEQEEWRKVSTEGKRCFYYVSNHGRIKSLSKKYRDNERLVKPYLSGCGYYYVDIGNRNQRFHSIIANAFLEPQPTLTHTIDHIDRNPSNNHLSNLRWATKSEQRENSSNYRHDIQEKDPKLRMKIIMKQSKDKLGYNDKVQCDCGKTYQRIRKTKHEATSYHQKRTNNNL
jgi:hypothetical protein